MNRADANIALAAAFVDELARRGVSRAVICPGSRSTPLALALDREPGIETTIVIDERSAGFLAVGMATATTLPVAVVTTSGTAAANLHPAVCEADESHVPLIALTADRPPELRGIGAGQTIDQIKLFGDSVRWFSEVGTHDADESGLLHYRSAASRAVAHCCDAASPGPVHLNLAWREPLAPTRDPEPPTVIAGLALDGRREGRPLTSVTPRPSTPAPIVTGAASELIGTTVKGVILAGRQRDPELAAALAALAVMTGFPVLAEPTSQARIAATGPNLVGGYEWIARLGPSALVPDLVLRFGEFPTSKALRRWIGGSESIEQIAVFESGWNDPTSRSGAIVRGRPSETARAICAALDDNRTVAEPSGWIDLWRRAQGAVEVAVEDSLAAAGLVEPRVHRALAGLYGSDEIVYTASSMPIRDQEAFLPALDHSPLFLANRGANGIDGLVSSGIGAAIATGRAVWIVTGDLGFVHDSNALMSLHATSAPVRVVVVNNDGGGIFEHLPQADVLEREQFERLFITPSGVDLFALCAAHRIDYLRIESFDQLANLPPAGCVIEVPTDGRADAALRATVAERTRDALVDALSIT